MNTTNNSGNNGNGVTIDLSNIDMGKLHKVISENSPNEEDTMSSLEMLADILFLEKNFDKAEKLIHAIKSGQPEIYKEIIFELLPEMTDYYLFNGDIDKAFICLDELSDNYSSDFLHFTHILDVFENYGYSSKMKDSVEKVLNMDKDLDSEDKEILESYININCYPTGNETLIKARDIFMEHSKAMNIPNLAANNIIDALIDYFESAYTPDESHIINFGLESYRNYLANIIEDEYIDIYKYGASILWGSVYFIDSMYDKQMITDDEYSHFLNIIERVKAFFIVNIPWDGIWKIRFLYNWGKPLGISEKEFIGEREIVERNIRIKAKDIINKSIIETLDANVKRLSYAKYLEEENIAFQRNIERANSENFGIDKKRIHCFHSSTI
jgi:hypothetical protein